MNLPRPDNEDFTVAWICALPVELQAATHVLDDVYEDIPHSRYTVGRIGEHNVVIACLPSGVVGTTQAAVAATQLESEFTCIRVRLMVGIGGGVPSKDSDVRLGDVVISNPEKRYGGVVQYDFGKVGAIDEHELTGFLNAPSMELLEALARFRTHSASKQAQINQTLTAFDALPTFTRESAGSDVLFQADFEHVSGETNDCSRCPKEMTVERLARQDESPRIHYGTVASGNKVIKKATTRDDISKRLGGVLCFEMEAAGLMNTFPCLVFRGICDYADSHKNKAWQPYASAVAASCAKAFLSLIPVFTSKETRRLKESTRRLGGWLSVPNPSVNYDAALKLREPETGLWFLNGGSYSNWLEQPSSILWLHGIPGAGKTVLFSTILENVKKRGFNDRLIGTAFFYFDFKDTQKQSSGMMVRSLVSNLAPECPKIPSSLRSLIDSCANGEAPPSTDTLLETLRDIIGTFRQCYILLDALDECSERTQLTHDLDTIAGWKLQNLHFLATSRRENDIEDCFEDITEPQCFVPLEESVVDTDIRTFVASRLSKEKKLKKWTTNSSIREEIEQALVDGAKGMFRWVVCQLDAIKRCRNVLQLRQELATLPVTLDATYDRILESIEPSDSEYAIRILRWLISSKRPMLLEELTEVVAIDTERNPMFVKEEKLQDINDVLDICHSLVSTKSLNEDPRVSRYGRPEWFVCRTTVELSHYSVKEYLVSSRMSSRSSLAKYRIRPDHSNEVIAMACLGYLFQFELIPSIMVKEIAESYPLAPYAARYWPDHARQINHIHWSERLVELSLKMFQVHNLYRKWLLLRDLQSGELHSATTYDLNVPPPLVFATNLHLNTVVKRLIGNGANLRVPWEWVDSQTALWRACGNGNNDLVEYLIPSYCGVEGYGARHPPLASAAWEGHTKTLELLIRLGADIHRSGQLALIRASEGHHYETVVRLLELGANVNTAANSRELQYLDGPLAEVTPLAAAVENYDMRIVQLLLDNGADVNATRDHFCQPLMNATMNADSKMVEHLFRYGAKVDQDGNGGPALIFTAISSGIYKAVTLPNDVIDVMRLLIENGADVNASSKEGDTALAEAVGRRSTQIMEFLLENGAVVTPEALAMAASIESVEIVERFLDMDSTIDRKPAIARAAQAGRVETIKILLDNASDENQEPPSLSPAITCAIEWGLDSQSSYEAIQFLLDRGADPNTAHEEHGTILAAAASRDRIRVVRLLLERGADVHAQVPYLDEVRAQADHGDVSPIVGLLLGRNVSEEAFNQKAPLFVPHHWPPDSPPEVWSDNFPEWPNEWWEGGRPRAF